MTGAQTLPVRGNENRSDPMQVLFCASPDYLQHVAVAAVSLLEAAQDQPVVLHVLMGAGDREAEARLHESLQPFPNAALHVYQVADERLNGVFTDRYLTKETYLRFIAPEVLPAFVGRVIYLDCDLVVLADPRPLWDSDLAGRAVGAVPECDWMAGSTENRLTKLGIPREHVYVNAGVLVLDLDRWRRLGLAGRLFRFIEERGPQLQYHDQDALNAVLPDEITLLDRRWNVQALMFSRWFRRALPTDYLATQAARRNPGIVHFTTEHKPWKHRCWTRKRALWQHYRDRTAWRDQGPTLATRAARLEHRLCSGLLRLGIDPYMLLPVWDRLRRSIRPPRPQDGRPAG